MEIKWSLSLYRQKQRCCNSVRNSSKGYLKKCSIVFHNRSNYDYQFLKTTSPKIWRTIQLFSKKHWKKHKISFSVKMEREGKKINKNGKEITKSISYRLQFNDNKRFMASWLSKLVDNLAEKIHKINIQNLIHVVLNAQKINTC